MIYKTIKLIIKACRVIIIFKNCTGFEGSPKTEFNQGEEFGSGLGVRKDTHIPTIKTKDGGGKNIAKIRGDALIIEYLEK